MSGLLEIFHILVLFIFILAFLLITIFTLYTFLRILKAPKIYRQIPIANVLAKELMCPKCGSKNLEVIGYYNVLRCRDCNFIFSVGIPTSYFYFPGIWIWPIWIWPIIWSRKV